MQHEDYEDYDNYVNFKIVPVESSLNAEKVVKTFNFKPLFCIGRTIHAKIVT